MKRARVKILCLFLCMIFVFSGCSTAVESIDAVKESSTSSESSSATQKQEEIVVSDEVKQLANNTSDSIELGEDLASGEQIESSFEEEQKLENGASVEQDDVAYEGTNSKQGLSLIGSYQGLTYFNQGDPRWANKPYTATGNKSQTMRSSACGPTSAAMVVSSSKGLILPTTMAELAVDNRFRTANNGTAWAYFPFVADFFDFNFYDETSSFSDALRFMKTDKDNNGISDYFIVMSCDSGLWTSSGHFVVWIDQSGNQSTIYDPYLYSGKFNTASRRRANVTVSGNAAYLSSSNLSKYSNAKRYFIYSNDQTGKATNKKPTSSTKINKTSVKYTRYVATQSQSLNVRSGPGTSYKIVGSIAKGSKVDVIAVYNGWSQIGVNKWVSTSYLSATKVTTSKPKTTTKNSAPKFKVGNTYTLTTNVKVRTGAGTNYAQKRKSQLTADGRKHALNQTYAVLRSGTKFTAQQIKKNGADIWIKIPSGWICVYYNGYKYAK